MTPRVNSHFHTTQCACPDAPCERPLSHCTILHIGFAHAAYAVPMGFAVFAFRITCRSIFALHVTCAVPLRSCHLSNMSEMHVSETVRAFQRCCSDVVQVSKYLRMTKLLFWNISGAGWGRDGRGGSEGVSGHIIIEAASNTLWTLLS